MVKTIEDIVIEAYNSVLSDLRRAQDQLAHERQRGTSGIDAPASNVGNIGVAAADYSDRETWNISSAPEPEPEHGKLAASGSGYRYNRVSHPTRVGSFDAKRFVPSMTEDIGVASQVASQLEEANHELRAAKKQHPWDMPTEASSENPLAQTARRIISDKEAWIKQLQKQIDDLRENNFELTKANRSLHKLVDAMREVK